MKEQYYLTPERFEELKAELITLKTVRRMEVADRLKRAKELGDLSENAEYSEAREEQAAVESRIFEVEDMIKNAVIIKHGTDSKLIEIGSTVVVDKGGKEFTYHIVGSNETKPEEGYISNESPLGKAFLGHNPGDKVSVVTPKGEVTYIIVKIG
jgi:transcription elongation factor GreA